MAGLPSYNVLNAQALPIWLRGDINGLVSICSGVGKLMLSGSGRPAGFFSVNCPPHGWVGSCWTRRTRCCRGALLREVGIHGLGQVPDLAKPNRFGCGEVGLRHAVDQLLGLALSSPRPR